MVCKKDKPTYKTKSSALRHGHITWGRTASGARKFRTYKVRGGWNVSRR